MPGMAASPAIFEYIKLPANKFELHYLEWSIPTKGISLAEYAKNMCTRVKHDNVVFSDFHLNPEAAIQFLKTL